MTAYCFTKFTQSHTNKTFEWFIFEIFRDIYDDLISNELLQELVGDIQNSDFHYNDEHHYGPFFLLN